MGGLTPAPVHCLAHGQGEEAWFIPKGCHSAVTVVTAQPA